MQGTLVLQIAIGRSRYETNWRGVEIEWPDFVRKVSATHRTAEKYAEYIKLPKKRQDEIKDVGGFVGGSISGGRRKNLSIINRCLLTLDIDNATDFSGWENFKIMFGNAAVIYTTHKHCPAKPRYRLIIPLDRPVFSDEYTAIGRYIAGVLGIDQFDPTTFEPARLMFWPSTASDGEFLSDSTDGPPINADGILTQYKDWRNIGEWAYSSKDTESVKREIKKQGNPLDKIGVIGAFCRTYNIHDVIEKFLTEEYSACDIANRYTFIQGSTAAGLVVYDDVFAFSHHATDPAGGKLCNAFDLVRLHKFGLRDEDAKQGTPSNKLPSYLAMLDFASADELTKRLLIKEKLGEASEDFNDDIESDKDWQMKLDIEKNGKIKDGFGNFLTILNNDPALSGIAFNQMRDGVDVHGNLPWNRAKPGWADTDAAKLYEYIQNNYQIYSTTKTNNAVLAAAVTRSFHPIREYLNELPHWDGIKRVETLFIDYFGAKNTSYVRAATRKTLTAAVARIYSPGIKFDCMSVLNGVTGLGKSTLYRKLAGKWFDDSLTFADMAHGKNAPEKIQGYWIVEIPEMAGMHKADYNNVKAFLSRQDDNYRASYGRQSESHPRQCIIVGSTNSESAGFLRDITGNRRFWPIKVSGDKARRGWDLADSDVLQIWAEAKLFWEHGEKLFLEGEDEEAAVREQTEAMEYDDREGIVIEYLDMLLPKNWYTMDIFDRRNYLRGDGTFIQSEEKFKRNMISNIEILTECFFKDTPTRLDGYEITAIMQKIPGWRRSDKKIRISKFYGPQYVWVNESVPSVP